jgi:hypothetical protein
MVGPHRLGGGGYLLSKEVDDGAFGFYVRGEIASLYFF